MTKVIRYTTQYLCMLSDYGSPERHRHPTAHLVCATEGSLRCKIGEIYSECSGILIRADMEHEIQADGQMLVFLFANTSPITRVMETRYFTHNAYAVLSEKSAMQIQNIIHQEGESIDIAILQALGIYSTEHVSADERLLTVIEALEHTATITLETMSELCAKTYLSQSRLSHLFRQEIGITLGSYLAFMKMKKAYEYAANGENLTSAAMRAGFDSSSHLAATCKRMFGISLSAFLRSQKS